QAIAQQQVSVEDIYSGKFSQQSVTGVKWMNDGQFYSSREGNDVVKIDLTTGKVVEHLVKGEDLQPAIQWDSYSFSNDEKKMLFRTEMESIYRRSFKATYYIYELESKKLVMLSEGGKQSYATFSPDGSKVAFVRNNNLFYVDLSNMRETQVTRDGKFNFIINGSADWVYEEEFGFAKAFYWSKDGNKLAYYRFDESRVQEYNMQLWNDSETYPVDYRFKYPKAGAENSVVDIYIYDLTSQNAVQVALGEEKDIYIPRINWTQDSNLLSVRRMSRLQNKLEIIHVNAQTGKGDVVLTEESETYVDINYCDDLSYLSNGTQFVRTSEKDGYKHIYLHQMDGSLAQQITKGNWEVTQFVGFDEAKEMFYYISTEDSPLERHFYSISAKGKKKRLSTQEGTNRVNMSPDFKLYINYHSNITSPLKVTLHNIKGKQLKELKNNKRLKEVVKSYDLPNMEFFDFQTTDKIKLHGWMIKPKDFDKNKKYPVLMFVYGGPGSQLVTNAWAGRNYYWHHMLAQRGYIVACVDNRGTDGRGAAFKKSTYANLGKYEVKDQIEAAKFLGDKPWVDESRIGIWGWSYGGYMSSLCMTLGADVFKAGIAVAPVSTWRYYDSIYTERFLKRPQDNPQGYDDYSPVKHAHKLKGAYFLIHGTGDDNVHFQNAIAMQNALIKANKQFKSFYYPNRNHGIYGGNTRIHLYNMMTAFILNNL
ncbi:MAG: S9 family peptidase, partial [Flammeovirgaceae bacterium]